MTFEKIENANFKVVFRKKIKNDSQLKSDIQQKKEDAEASFNYITILILFSADFS